MAIESAYKHSVSVKLNAGTNASGSMRIKSCSLGDMAESATANQIEAIASALTDVLEFPVTRVERTLVTVVEA